MSISSLDVMEVFSIFLKAGINFSASKKQYDYEVRAFLKTKNLTKEQYISLCQLSDSFFRYPDLVYSPQTSWGMLLK